MFFLETFVVLNFLSPSSIRSFDARNLPKTLSKPVSFNGIGLHTGKKSFVKVLPAEENNGITFKRTDLENNNLIKADFSNVSSARLCTTLENNYGVKVSTVEHLLAALYISEIDNAIVEIDSEEVPIMDGSSKDFLDVIKNIEKIDQSKKEIILKLQIKSNL